MNERDVIIVGAGLAGAAAALSLGKAGFRVTVLEARARLGGRAFVKPFEGAGPMAPALEYGGGWITPWHTRLRALVAECGLTLRPRHPLTNRFWLREGALHADGPVSAEHRSAHERVVARVAADAILLKMGMEMDEKGRALTGISFKTYLDRLNPPKATRDVFSAWWTVSGNGDHSSVAASEFLSSCAYGDGLAEAMMEFWADTVSPGMAVLAERMIALSKAALHVETPVVSIAQMNNVVRATTTAGQNFEGAHCIVALGVNQLPAISFTPALSPAKQAAITRGHDGRAFKLWAMARGVPVGTLVTGDGAGIEFAFAERATESGMTMIIGFGLDDGASEPGNPQWVKRQMSRLFPNAEIIASDWHDWVNDPFARGTWVAAPVGFEAGFAHDNWQPESRLAFATSDIARENAGWFEGAVIAGEDAAKHIFARAQ